MRRAVASQPAAKPTIAIVPNSAAKVPHGTLTCCGAHCGMSAMAAAREPTANPPTSSTAFSQTTIRTSRPRRNPVARMRASSPRRSNTPPQLHHGQANRTQQQAQRTEALKRRQVGVLHGEEASELVAGVAGVDAICSKGGFEHLCNLITTFNSRRATLAGNWRCFDQKVPIPTGVGEHPQEVDFAHKQVALQHAVLQEPDNFQHDWPVGRVADFQLRADAFQVQTINCGAGVEHDGHDRTAGAIVAQISAKQGPGIFGRTSMRVGIGRRRKIEAAAVNESIRQAQHAGLRRTIEIEATRILTGRDAQRVDSPVFKLLTGFVPKSELAPACRRIEVVVNRLIARGGECEAAGAACRPCRGGTR